MSKKKPRQIYVAGARFKLVVLRVEDHDEHGRPASLNIIREHDVCELSADPTRNHFILGYIKADILDRDVNELVK